MTTLTGARVLLRPLAKEDAELIVAWRGDPIVAMGLFSECPPTLDEHRAWAAGLAGRTDRLEFVIIVRESSVPVGTIGLSVIDRNEGRAEFGVLLGDPAWRGLGVAREAGELILRHAFEGIGLRTVVLDCFVDNRPAIALYRRLGFVDDGPATLRTKAGVPRTSMRMVLARDDWRRRSDDA